MQPTVFLVTQCTECNLENTVILSEEGKEEAEVHKTFLVLKVQKKPVGTRIQVKITEWPLLLTVSQLKFRSFQPMRPLWASLQWPPNVLDTDMAGVEPGTI